MQKNENQNRWDPIVVGITEPYPGLYLHPWALRGESHTIFFSAQEQRQEVKKKQLQQYVYMSQKCLWRGSNGHLLLDMRRMNIMNFSLVFSFATRFCVTNTLPLWAMPCLY